MLYEAPKQPQAVVSEAGPVLVTPLERLKGTAANVDCPYCKKVVKTEVKEVESGDDGYISPSTIFILECMLTLSPAW